MLSLRSWQPCYALALGVWSSWIEYSKLDGLYFGGVSWCWRRRVVPTRRRLQIGHDVEDVSRALECLWSADSDRETERGNAQLRKNESCILDAELSSFTCLFTTETSRIGEVLLLNSVQFWFPRMEPSIGIILSRYKFHWITRS